MELKLPGKKVDSSCILGLYIEEVIFGKYIDS